ncbi:AAA family ATPase [Priestia aryabhattai]|uniref:AAA family ATPase n=1 Tax=Priestia aryabhattai TaxID=412384 RepID=UPI00366D2D3B
MSYTPVVRWRNFNLQNLKSILEIYPDLSNNIPRKDANEILEDNYSGYKKTVYQFACQLGLEDRSVNYLKIQNYLYTFTDEYLEKYLEFWIKTYYSPNPYIKGEDEPILIYKEIAQRVLKAEGLQINFTAFFIDMFNEGKKSYDILLNALSNYGKPLKKKKIGRDDYLYINETDRNKLESELGLIESNFLIPSEPKSKKAYFERYNYSNFALFFGLKTTLEKKDASNNWSKNVNKKVPKNHNRILIGAPGTGKSYKLKVESEGDSTHKGYFLPENIERVTFYSNYTYSQFVGTYKPKPKSRKRISEDNSKDIEHDYITYEYVPGPFLKLLVKSLNDYIKNGSECNNYLLIVEEINRASNPAGAFGDIFQLLDRDSNGISQYAISFSEDMRLYLEKEGLSELSNIYLPPNFYIWATMNNADQGVHPLDSAFQRRWSPEYIDINENESEIMSYNVTIKGYGLCNWNSFRKCLNSRLIDLNVKEDKLIGPFFIKKEELNDQAGELLEESTFQKIFKNKLIRYLSEEVFKFNNRGELFGNYKTFSQLISAYDSNEEKIFLKLDENIFINDNPKSEDDNTM